MLTWLSANLSTLLISLVLFAVVISIVRYLIRQKKQGKHTCGCSGGCAGCSGDLPLRTVNTPKKNRRVGHPTRLFFSLLTCLQFEFLLRKRIRF